MNTPTLYRARTHMRISRVIRRSAGKTLALTLLSIFATSALAAIGLYAIMKKLTDE